MTKRLPCLVHALNQESHAKTGSQPLQHSAPVIPSFARILPCLDVEAFF